MPFDPKNYDSSWDDDNQELWDEKYAEWEKRDWKSWFTENLTFPFVVKREDDEDDVYFESGAASKPFRLGHTMEVTGIEYEDDLRGVIVNVKEGQNTGNVPLCDVTVMKKSNINYWPVHEYAVWFANR